MIKRSLIFWLNLSAPDRDDKTWSILEESRYQTARNRQVPMAIKI